VRPSWPYSQTPLESAPISSPGITHTAVNYGATIIWHIARMSDENQLRPRQVDQTPADFAALKSEDIEAIYARFGVPPPAHLNRTALGVILCMAILAIPLGWFLVQRHHDKLRAVMELMLAACLLWALALAYIKGKIPYGRAFFRVLYVKESEDVLSYWGLISLHVFFLCCILVDLIFHSF
jgi:hypothetical protein